MLPPSSEDDHFPDEFLDDRSFLKDWNGRLDTDLPELFGPNICSSTPWWQHQPPSELQCHPRHESDSAHPENIPSTLQPLTDDSAFLKDVDLSNTFDYTGYANYYSSTYPPEPSVDVSLSITSRKRPRHIVEQEDYNDTADRRSLKRQKLSVNFDGNGEGTSTITTLKSSPSSTLRRHNIPQDIREKMGASTSKGKYVSPRWSALMPLEDSLDRLQRLLTVAQ